MTFLTISRVTELLCSFRLVLGEKIGKEIPESSRLVHKISAVLSAQGSTSRPLNRRGISGLLLLRTLSPKSHVSGK